MEQLAWLPKFLAELAYKLFSEKGKEHREKKIRFAELIDRIADCTSEIGSSIQQGVHPTSQCAELSLYLSKIQELAAEITDEKTAANLMFWLHHVEAVPGFAKINFEDELKFGTKPPWSSSKRFSQGRSILEISGTMKAMGNLLKV